MDRRPFRNVSWHRPFLPALMDILLDLSDGDLSTVYCVFPHTRPALYLTELLHRDIHVAKPCILPRMDSISGLFSRLGPAVRHRGTPVGMLDKVALLLSVVRTLRQEHGGLLRELPLDDSRRFFPWGIRLADLMEDFFVHNRIPEDYTHMQDQVAPFAAALLENLGAIHARYVAGLIERGWTTPGFDAALVAQALTRGEEVVNAPGISGKCFVLAGFHTLTGTQAILFRHLWEQHGATVCLHADPAVVDGSPHWSCAPLVRWASAWRTTILPYSDTTPENRPHLAFRAGYDAHSQISELVTDLKHAEPDRREGESWAVVLPDTSLLMPVLHNLPEADRNISMGYPLARSPLFRLIESILSLQETRRGTGPYTYHWKAIITLLRHPYLKMLVPTEDPSDRPGSGFRRFLHCAERVVRTSRRFFPLEELTDRTVATWTDMEETVADPALADLLRKILRTAVFAWEELTAPADIALALQGLADLMRDHGNALWSRFPIDAECLYRVTESIIPQLAHTALREENLPLRTMFAVLRELLAGERVPFEAYPLVGDQVLGVLETRLLHFDRVFMLDLTEDKLPGASGHDPLLPDALRSLAGLPGKHGRETVAAYNFFRLVNGARHISLYWQEGVARQGLLETKKTRSRFVEELLWREEETLGRILCPERPENQGTDGPLRLIPCILPPIPRKYVAIPLTESTHERMQHILRGELSPSLLDAYLRCPAHFYYQRIGRIRAVETVTEGRDPLATGLFLHEVLRRYFAERTGIPVTATTAAADAIRGVFLDCLADSDLPSGLPADEYIMLEEAVPPILRTLLENHCGRVPLYLEEKFRADVLVDGEKRTLSGIIDRVDDGGNGLLVLDYKTGHIPAVSTAVWQDTAFWEIVLSWGPGRDDTTFDALARAFDSVQLPVYIHMVRAHTGAAVQDAAYVPLRMGTGDVFLLGDAMPDAVRELAVNTYIPALLAFLMRHMATTTVFTPKPGRNCDWCFYKNICMMTGQ